MNAMERVLREQRECRDYILENKGDDTDGAWHGLEDWVKEELLMLAEQSNVSRETGYDSFLDRKAQCGARGGFKPTFNPSFLFDFQGYLNEYNCEMGRSATFADCGMGKTPLEHVWAENVVRHTNKPVLELTPLAVAAQAVREAEKFGIDAVRCNDGKVSGTR